MRGRRRTASALASLTVLAALAGCTEEALPTVAPLPAPDASLRAAAPLDPCPTPSAPTARSSAAGESLPAVTLPCLDDGPAVPLGDLRGPAVVNVWAQYCPPCREEMPVLQRLHERAGDRLLVLGVDHQDDPSWALEYAAERGVTYPSVYDADGEAGLLQGTGLPQTLFVDEQGAVVHRHLGAVSEQKLDALVREHLGVDP